MSIGQMYVIRVEGELDVRFSERLGGMTIACDDSDGSRITTLHGSLRDQAALSGVLNTLYDWHLTVISVERLNEE